jgi:NADH:ubiquinone oxidoreductase subunit D
MEAAVRNFSPQHRAAHGVLRLVVARGGEVIQRVGRSHIGRYLALAGGLPERKV